MAADMIVVIVVIVVIGCGCLFNDTILTQSYQVLTAPFNDISRAQSF
jgi:hypothetical protein